MITTKGCDKCKTPRPDVEFWGHACVHCVHIFCDDCALKIGVIKAPFKFEGQQYTRVPSYKPCGQNGCKERGEKTMKTISDYYTDIRKVVATYSLADIISLLDTVGNPPEGLKSEAVRRLRRFEELLSDAPEMPKGAERFDGKFHGRIFKNKNREEVRADEFCVFLAKDNAFLPTLRFYRDECARQGAKDAQIKAVEEMINRCAKWRDENVDRLKTPDVEPGEIQTR